jgi:peptidoglycan hydrolase CwlO-like protein
MVWRSTSRLARRSRAAWLAVLIAACAAVAAPAGATDIGALQSRVDQARQQAGALAADLEAKQRQMVAAQQQAAAAAARERQLGAMLAAGEQRSAELGQKVAEAQRQLAIERGRLHRALVALRNRLVAMYESGTPDITSMVLNAHGFSDLVTSANYLRMIQDSDNKLAARVRQIRDAVKFQLGVVQRLKARQDAYNVRLASARDQIAAVRQRAEAQASALAAARAAREASLSALQSNISGWMSEIEQAQQVSAAQAQSTVGRWLGGPYSIPSSIVACESGGNYGAVNPSSGAGGAYQILPSTWHLYGGNGTPQGAPKQEQDQIAAQIWADSGPGAWACAG